MSESNRGRKAVFLDVETVNQALRSIQSGAFKSRYLTIKLVDMGLVEACKSKGEGRGRPRIVYNLTDKGRSQIAEI